MAKSRAKKAVEAVEEAVTEVVVDAKAEYENMVKELGKKQAKFQQQSKVSAAKHLRNAIRAIRFVIDELEKGQ